MSLRHVVGYDEEEDQNEVNEVNGNDSYLEDGNGDDTISSSDNSDISSSEEERQQDNKTNNGTPIAHQMESEDDMFASDDDNEGNKPSIPQEDEDDDDMFASDDDDNNNNNNNSTTKPTKQPKQVQFSNKNTTIHLNPTSIDDSKTQAKSEDDDDESTDNEYYINAEEFTTSSNRKKRQPKMEAFNMDQEERDGHFNKVGDYISNKEEGDDDSDSDSDKPQNEDSWAMNLSKSDIRKAKLAQSRRQQQQELNESHKDGNMDPVEVVYASLIGLLEPAESPMEALARLNAQLKHNKRNNKSGKSKSKRKRDQNDKHVEHVLDSTIIKQNISQITNFCSVLINDKHMDVDEVYDMTREQFMRMYQSETGEEYNQSTSYMKRHREEEDNTNNNNDNEEITDGISNSGIVDTEQPPQSSHDDYGDKIWEFKWVNDDTNTINGPYSNYEMSHWKTHYFENNVEVRKLGDVKFVHIQDIHF
ncbi:hypothetical protein I9W82_002262 [Candida metapsilosis]|uniref:GYF domain-containing protein n=1 Tax=Candida metapsilosis TaxID=273372 RepID=A0A8H8DDX1_9ASCO|nr:hypothetical protein I9W82_002262 [Candida metapsilosis]